MIDKEARNQFALALRRLGSERDPKQLRPIDFIVRGIMALDLILLILTFIPTFSGLGPEPGMADRLWGTYRIGFWRIDFVWMCVSTVGILAGGLRPTVERGSERTTSNLALAWLPCFFIYICYIVMHMF